MVKYAIDEEDEDGVMVYQDMRNRHILLPVSGVVQYEKPANSTSTAVQASEVRSAQATTYSNSIGGLTWLPQNRYVWSSDFNESGTPVETFSHFSHDPDAENTGWALAENSVGYNWRGFPRGKCTPTLNENGYMHTSVIYGYHGTFPVGTVENSTFLECGVFTGEYQDPYQPQRWWDFDNGWEKGGVNPPELVTTTAHFGYWSIHASNDYAAGRNCSVYPGKAYTMTAWVKVMSGTVVMMGDFRYVKTASENNWPLYYENDLVAVDDAKIRITPVSMSHEGSGNETWRLMKIEIPSTLTTKLDKVKKNRKWYLRIWVGNHPVNEPQYKYEAYIDDVRFSPSDAYVTTTYYDPVWQVPMMSVDANNNPGHKIVLDGFGRPIGEYKLYSSKTAGEPGHADMLRTKEYHLMGEE